MFKFIQEKFNKAIGKPFPLKYIYFNTTGSSCTNKCYMCPIRSFKPDYKKMSDEVFYKAINNLRSMDFKDELHLYAQNEPFMDKDIFNKIDYISQNLPKAQIALISNFTLLNDEKIDKILSSPISFLSCSIYALKKENYQKICGKDNFKRSFINQIKFMKKFALNPFLSFAIYLMNDPYNQDDIEFCKYFLFNVAPISRCMFYQNCAFHNTIHKKQDHNKHFISTCINTHMLVNSNGDVSICSIDPTSKMKVGSLLYNSLNEIYNSLAARNIRKRMFSDNDKEAYCKYCGFGKKEHILVYFLPIPQKIKDYLNKKLLQYYNLYADYQIETFSESEIKRKSVLLNEIFKDGDEDNWINCLEELRRKFYAKEL